MNMFFLKQKIKNKKEIKFNNNIKKIYFTYNEHEYLYIKESKNDYYSINIFIENDGLSKSPIYTEQKDGKNIIVERNYFLVNDDFYKQLQKQKMISSKYKISKNRIINKLEYFYENFKDIIINDINKKFNQFFDKDGKDSYFMIIKNGDEIEIKNFENDYKIKNDDKHQNIYFIKNDKEIPIYRDYKDNIVGTDICNREINKELFTEDLFNFLKSEENKSGLIKLDYDNYDSLLQNSNEIKEKEYESLNKER